MSTLSSESAARNLERASFRVALDRLSARLRRAAARTIAPKGDFATVQALASQASIRGVSVMGEYGLVEGPVDDASVLAAYARTGTWRPAVARFFNEFFEVHGQGSFLDIGANIGLTTIPVARNAAVTCFGFEPDPDNFRYLRNNVLVNCPHRNVQLFELALFDRPGSFEFRRHDRYKGNHHLSPEGAEPASDEGAPAIRVPTVRLDDFLSPQIAHAPRPLAAKLVAQGAEAQIVAGGQAVLSSAAAMLIEVYPYGIARLGGNVEHLLQFCSSHFSHGALNIGENDDALAWLPIGDVTARLRSLYQPATRTPTEYFHLFLKS